MKKAAIFSALGQKSFTPAQVRLLRRNLDVQFIPCLKPLGPDPFVRLARPHAVLGITRRTLKDFNAALLS